MVVEGVFRMSGEAGSDGWKGPDVLGGGCQRGFCK